MNAFDSPGAQDYTDSLNHCRSPKPPMMVAKTDTGGTSISRASRRGRRLVSGLLAAGLWLSTSAGAEEPPGFLAGMVRGTEATPIASAQVYAYSMADFELRKVLTDLAGRFQFAGLPAGLYNIVAYKPGFVPAVVALIRPEAERDQTLDVHLLPEDPSQPHAAEDYWEARSRVPADVLRDIETQALGATLAGSTLAESLSRFSTGLEASTGVDDIVALGEAQLTGGRLSFEGQLEWVDIGVQGDFWRLQPTSIGAQQAAVEGSANQVSVDLKSQGESHFSLTTASNRLVTRQGGIERPVDFDRVRLDYSQAWGDSGGQSAFSAQVIDEANFYSGGALEPADIPRASRTWEVEGSYSREISDRTMVATGVRYRERQAEMLLGPALSPVLPGPVDRMDIFGEGGYRVRPAMLIEYGVYTVLRDGNLALAPQGGLVLQINPHWQVAGRASGRFSDQASFEGLASDFLPTLYRSTQSACDQGDERCYQVQLTRKEGDETLSLGAVHRELGETLRLYFSDDFFDRQESVYLVPGDRLPELQLAVTHRLSPNILTRLESTYADGGGGTFYASNRDAYENEVRYLITSVDAQFRSTSTGVFLAFHQLRQSLLPQVTGAPSMEPLLSERLQLKVSQDLNVLLDLPADWALQLNMELSRGSLSDDEDKDALRRRILGGIAVKF